MRPAPLRNAKHPSDLFEYSKCVRVGIQWSWLNWFVYNMLIDDIHFRFHSIMLYSDQKIHNDIHKPSIWWYFDEMYVSKSSRDYKSLHFQNTYKSCGANEKTPPPFLLPTRTCPSYVCIQPLDSCKNRLNLMSFIGSICRSVLFILTFCAYEQRSDRSIEPIFAMNDDTLFIIFEMTLTFRIQFFSSFCLLIIASDTHNQHIGVLSLFVRR